MMGLLGRHAGASALAFIPEMHVPILQDLAGPGASLQINEHRLGLEWHCLSRLTASLSQKSVQAYTGREHMVPCASTEYATAIWGDGCVGISAGFVPLH